MPVRSSYTEAQSGISKAQRARRYLKGVGISREDSDDELGYEDHPWEWIYEGVTDTQLDGGEENEASNSAVGTNQNAVDLPDKHALDSEKSNSRITKRGARGRIIGAQMGGFRCKLGDCVLLKAEGTNEAWVGLICEFAEGEDEQGKMANIMWFSTEKEIKNKQKKRTDFMQVFHPWREDGIRQMDWALRDILERAVYHPVVGYEPPSLNQRPGHHSISRRVPCTIS